ncbi:MAG: hypothetical protein Q9181_001742 [Wetmoreana brouardii]
MTLPLPDLASFDLRQLLQIAFVSAAVTILFLSSLPPLRTRFLTYGSRATSHDVKPRIAADENTRQDVRPPWEFVIQFLDYLAKLQVPHGWFLHFYVVSVACSVFWGFQIVFKTPLLVKLCDSAGWGGTMSLDQIALTWSLMAAQGVRRLMESTTLGKASASKMWIVHWMLGIAFYAAMSIAVWIDGADTILHSHSPFRGITFSAPSIRTMLGVPLFLLASGIQHDCHAYLASLPKYTVPNHPIFHTAVCPHYTAECVIYLSLAIIGSPEGAWVNRTVFTALVFVATNLAVTASTTKEWYVQKFGKEKVGHRWRMIPFVF